MSQGQRVSDSDMIALEGKILERFESVKGQLNHLQNVINSLEGAWEGIGAHAFDRKQNSINNQMVHMGRLLLDFLEAMKATRTLKGDTEEEVRKALMGIDVVDGYSHDAGATSAITSNLSTY
ncbi:WXG100 family type VII secretion target [Streptomyces sp. ASQP_92]|uniref:WXG100 family type VII secretion target n=1 Tax=unclassified Streptomyces TaxID=2593676 RepID=UPI0021BFF2CF|nr:WXG100 family type VII secretion target [Streptomyces sp. ASQP_92]MCT9093296.1 WXG100 family type VII secretion target [Streptomyces sp. ASQP_92]